ncbi:unnamed protein product, partial [Urochloa humidicola]
SLLPPFPSPLRSGVSARGQAGSSGAAAVASNEVLLLLQLHGSTVKHIPHDVKAMLNTGRFEGQQVSYKNKRSKLVTGLQQLLVGMISVQTRHIIICLSALPSSCFFHYQDIDELARTATSKHPWQRILEQITISVSSTFFNYFLYI